jgi:hypothetical protein
MRYPNIRDRRVFVFAGFLPQLGCLRSQRREGVRIRRARIDYPRACLFIVMHLPGHEVKWLPEQQESRK